VIIEPGGFLSRAVCQFLPFICKYFVFKWSDGTAISEYSFQFVISQLWLFRRLKVTEHEVTGGDAPNVVIRITGRPLTFPAGDQ